MMRTLRKMADELGKSSVLATVYGIDIRIEEIDGKRIGVYFA